MYTKTVCPHCGQKSYIDISASLLPVQTGIIMDKVTIIDTVTEDDLVKIVSKFVHGLILKGTSTEDIQGTLSKCMGISPQYTAELITRIVLSEF